MAEFSDSTTTPVSQRGDTGGTPISCQVAALAKENAALSVALDAADEESTKIPKPELDEKLDRHLMLERQMETITARQYALQDYASNLAAERGRRFVPAWHHRPFPRYNPQFRSG